jgi:tripartite-type tricarboxylate transporter receptor subunit TctC
LAAPSVSAKTRRSRSSALLSGAEFNHVPYKGAGPALAEVVAGHVDFTVATMPAGIQQVRSSGLRALGISSQTRSPELPDVPTTAETGLPGYEYVAWFGVFAPGTTRPELVARINALMPNLVRIAYPGRHSACNADWHCVDTCRRTQDVAATN